MIACDEETESVPDGAPGWTEEQRYAIERREGDLLLDAGAGSGKTSVLVERELRPAWFDPEPDPVVRGSYMHYVLEEVSSGSGAR